MLDSNGGMNKQASIRRAGRPRAEESEQKRERLITTALQEFARAGFHAASVREIAEKAEISSRTLYNYYPEKLALLEACLEYSARQFRPVLPALKGGLHSQLVTYATEMQRYLSKPLSMQIARLIFRESSDFEGLREIARLQFERHQVVPVAAILEKGGVDPARSQLLAMQFVAMAFGEWHRRLLYGRDPLTRAEMAEQAELTVGIFLNGIGKS
ncbi:putative TetR family transcriptional regulator [Sphingomonas paucimobilis]|nr:putative TetR family transcriptional regulator [Sphingomonas paucimobilis]